MVKARSRPRSNETFESELRVRPKNGFMTIVQMPHCDPVDFNLQASVEAWRGHCAESKSRSFRPKNSPGTAETPMQWPGNNKKPVMSDS